MAPSSLHSRCTTPVRHEAALLEEFSMLHRHRSLAGALLALAMAPLLAACPDSEDIVRPEPPTPPATASIQLGASRTQVTVGPNQPASALLQLTRSGPSESVSFSTVAPVGLSAVVSPATLPASQSQAVIDLTQVAPLGSGRYDVVVRARSASGSQDSVTLAVDVVAPPLPALTLQVVPSPVAVTAGGAAPVIVRVTRPQNLTGAVTFTVGTNAAGATVTTSPAVEMGVTTEQQLLVRVPASATPGTVTVPLSATLAQTSGATLPLTVQIAAPSPRSVTLQRCDPAVSPILVAVGDGLFGPAQRVIPDASGTLRFTVTQPAATVTLVERDEDTADDLRVTTLTASAEEWAALAAASCLGRRASRDQPIVVRSVWRNAVISGPFSGQVGVPNESIDITQAVTGSVTRPLRVPVAGRYTIAAGRNQSVVNGGPFDRMIIKRDLEAAATEPVTIDFASVEAFQPSLRSVTTTGVTGELVASSYLLTAEGTPLWVTPNSTSRTPTGLAVISVPMPRRSAGEMMGFVAAQRTSFRIGNQFQSSSMEQISETVLAEDRDASVGFTAPRLRTLWLTSLPGNYARVAFEGETDAVGVREYTHRVRQERGLLGARTFEYRITAAALAAFRVPAGTNRFRLETPNLSGLPEWRDTFMPQFATSTRIQVEEAGWSSGALPFRRERTAGSIAQLSIITAADGVVVPSPASRVLLVGR